MKAIAFAILLVGLERRMPKQEYSPGDLALNGLLQLIGLCGFFYCIWFGV